MAGAGYYDALWRRHDAPNPDRVALAVKAAADAASGRSDASILDVGCGNGPILAGLRARLGASSRLFGIEPSAVGAANARLRVPQAVIWEGTLETFGSRGTFDVVVCSEVIEHVRGQEKFAGLLAAVTAEGGTLVLTTPNGRYRDAYFEHYRLAPQPVEEWLTLRQITRLCDRRFRILEASTFDLSYACDRRPAARLCKNALVQLPGGRRIWSAFERFFLQKLLPDSGLYQLVVMKRRLAAPS